MKRKLKIIKYLCIVLIPIIIATYFVILVSSAYSRTKEEVVALIQSGQVLLDDKPLPGKATYVGVDDTDTDFAKKILAQTRKWSDEHNPYFNGYDSACELFCFHIYHEAGVPYNGSCCAFNHYKKGAIQTGKIPKGALVFSGYKPTGEFYENNHRPGAYCHICNNWAGHVGIYVGNGYIVGSQIPYYMEVDTWIIIFGYGGYSLK